MSKTATATEAKGPTLKTEVLELADRIEAALNVDNKTGMAPAADDIYEQTLPEDVTMTLVNKIEKHNANFIAASTYALGRVGTKALAGHKKLDSVETVIKMGGKNELHLTMERQRTYPNPQDKENPIVKHGVISVNYDIVADNNAGQLKIARSLINDLAADALK